MDLHSPFMAVSCFLLEKSPESVLLVSHALGTHKNTLIVLRDTPNALVHFPKTGWPPARGVNSLNSTDMECFNRSIEVHRSFTILFLGFVHLWYSNI